MTLQPNNLISHIIHLFVVELKDVHHHPLHLHRRTLRVQPYRLGVVVKTEFPVLHLPISIAEFIAHHVIIRSVGLHLFKQTHSLLHSSFINQSPYPIHLTSLLLNLLTSCFLRRHNYDVSTKPYRSVPTPKLLTFSSRSGESPHDGSYR